MVNSFDFSCQRFFPRTSSWIVFNFKMHIGNLDAFQQFFIPNTIWFVFKKLSFMSLTIWVIIDFALYKTIESKCALAKKWFGSKHLLKGNKSKKCCIGSRWDPKSGSEYNGLVLVAFFFCSLYNSMDKFVGRILAHLGIHQG
jgi:hypothetical protein